ncbi:hypothetical protein LSTR_LSTR013105 [Laodelphax striatellus]|uniref:Large ribosomal subunit protein eL14 n=1 Tax=Laodelphax striatellus TaxID=195883 RepID=A0A482XKF3_LAOST|nr:hypothetical protein LSTR_LSTR013105 [Laodelphax striatellus]
MPYKRFVETGRVAYIADGPAKGKLCTIVDIVNQTKALVDGPETGVPRSQIRLNQLHLTKFRMKFPFTASTKVVRTAWKKDKIDEKWKESIWAKKVAAKKRRAELTDFDRFKLRNAKKVRNVMRKSVYLSLKLEKQRQARVKLNAKMGIKKERKPKREKKPKAKKTAAPVKK